MNPEPACANDQVVPVANAKWDIVVVAYNSADDLERHWAGEHLNGWANIIVVDNDSRDQSASISEKFATVTVRSANHGLSRSNNLGAGLGTAPNLLFCNPDVRITPRDLIELEEELAHRNGVVAPRLVGEDGLAQPNARAFPSPWRQISRKTLPTSRSSRSYLWPQTTSGQVDWVTGACVAMKRDTFVAIGGWPESIFLYFEDVELCSRARDNGFGVYIAEHVRVLHSWKQDSKQIISSAGLNHLRSAFKYYRRRPRELFRV